MPEPTVEPTPTIIRSKRERCRWRRSWWSLLLVVSSVVELGGCGVGEEASQIGLRRNGEDELL